MDKVIKKVKGYDCPMCMEKHDINVYQEPDGHKYFYCENQFEGRDAEGDEEGWYRFLTDELEKLQSQAKNA